MSEETFKQASSVKKSVVHCGCTGLQYTGTHNYSHYVHAYLLIMWFFYFIPFHLACANSNWTMGGRTSNR